jgi:Tfp pilus assembly protein PilN
MKAVNLLPSDQRGSGTTVAVAAAPAKPPAFGAYVVLGFLALAVAALAAYVLTGNTIKDRKAELAQAKQQVTEAQGQASSLQAYADFKGVVDQRTATVRDLAKARFDWPQALNDLSRVIPDDVRLNKVEGTVNSSSGSDIALRSSIQAPALELFGCTTTQAEVARLMSRLQDVRGVSRVTLSSSAKPDDASAPATGDAAAGTVAECPKGSPPAFEIVVFFERFQLGAGAVVNPAAGTGATTSATGATSTTTGTTGTTTASATATPAAGTTSSTSTTTATATATPAAGTTSTTATQGVSAP